MLETFLHLILTVLCILAGIQDWRKREVADWLTWPLFGLGAISVIVRAAHLNLLPLLVCALVLIVWYFNWLGGADARVLIGLWGLWPLAGLLGMVCTGLWGLVLVLRRRGQERIPALIAVAFATCLTFLLEVAKMTG